MIIVIVKEQLCLNVFSQFFFPHLSNRLHTAIVPKQLTVGRNRKISGSIPGSNRLYVIQPSLPDFLIKGLISLFQTRVKYLLPRRVTFDLCFPSPYSQNCNFSTTMPQILPWKKENCCKTLCCSLKILAFKRTRSETCVLPQCRNVIDFLFFRNLNRVLGYVQN